MSDRKQVNEADLGWLAERDQPINDAMQSAATGSGEPRQMVSRYTRTVHDEVVPNCAMAGCTPLPTPPASQPQTVCRNCQGELCEHGKCPNRNCVWCDECRIAEAQSPKEQTK